MAEIASFFLDGGPWMFGVALAALVGAGSVLVGAIMFLKKKAAFGWIVIPPAITLLVGVAGQMGGHLTLLDVLERVPRDQKMALFMGGSSVALAPFAWGALCAGALSSLALLACLPGRQDLAGRSRLGVVWMLGGVLMALFSSSLVLFIGPVAEPGGSIGSSIAGDVTLQAVFQAVVVITGGVVLGLLANRRAEAHENQARILAATLAAAVALYLGTTSMGYGFLTLAEHSALNIIARAPPDQAELLQMIHVSSMTVRQLGHAAFSASAAILAFGAVALRLRDGRAWTANGPGSVAALLAVGFAFFAPGWIQGRVDASWDEVVAEAVPSFSSELELPQSSSRAAVESGVLIQLHKDGKVVFEAEPGTSVVGQEAVLEAAATPEDRPGTTLIIAADARAKAMQLEDLVEAAFHPTTGQPGFELIELLVDPDTEAEMGTARSAEERELRRQELTKLGARFVLEPVPPVLVVVDSAKKEFGADFVLLGITSEGCSMLWSGERGRGAYAPFPCEDVHARARAMRRLHPRARRIAVGTSQGVTVQELVRVLDDVRETQDGRELFSVQAFLSKLYVPPADVADESGSLRPEPGEDGDRIPTTR